MCGENKNFKGFTVGYLQTCCRKECKNTYSGQMAKESIIDKYGEYYVNAEKMKETKIKKYGCLNSHIPKTLKTKKETIKNGLNTFQRASIKANKTKSLGEWKKTTGKIKEIKTRETKVKNGNWISIKEKELFKLYSMIVWRLTKRNDLSKLKNYDKRGRIEIPGSYHLDHKISLSFGFTNGILPNVIADISNLEMMPAIENIKKGTKCSMKMEVE